MVPAPTRAVPLQTVVTPRELVAAAHSGHAGVCGYADRSREAVHEGRVEVPFRRIGLSNALLRHVFARNAGVANQLAAGIEIINVGGNVVSRHRCDLVRRAGKLVGSATNRLRLERAPQRDEPEATQQHPEVSVHDAITAPVRPGPQARARTRGDTSARRRPPFSGSRPRTTRLASRSAPADRHPTFRAVAGGSPPAWGRDPSAADPARARRPRWIGGFESTGSAPAIRKRRRRKGRRRCPTDRSLRFVAGGS